MTYQLTRKQVVELDGVEIPTDELHAICERVRNELGEGSACRVRFSSQYPGEVGSRDMVTLEFSRTIGSGWAKP